MNLKKILPLLSQALPEDLAYKGLSKIDPKMAKFMASSSAAGYGASEIINFLRDNLGSTKRKEPREGTFEEQAEEEVQRQGQIVPNITKKGVALGSAALASPIIGSALSSGMMGGSFKEGSQPPIIPEQGGDQEPSISEPEQTPAETIEITSIDDLMNVSPEIGKYVKHWMSKGMIPETIDKSMEETLLQPRVQELEQIVGKSFLEILQGISQGRQKKGEAQERLLSKENLMRTDEEPISGGSKALLDALKRLEGTRKR